MPKSAALRVSSAGKDYVRGTAPAGSLVRVVNTSMAPFAGRKVRSATAHGYAGKDGSFELKVPGALSGDWAQVSVVKSTRSQAQSAISARLWGKDARRPEISLRGLRLEPGANDTVTLRNVRKNRAICEPFAHVRFINQRTKTSVNVKLNHNGELPVDLVLGGRQGDLFSVKITDGRHNPSLRATWGYVAVGRADVPAPHPDHANTKLVDVKAPLVRKGFGLHDPKQGELGDCGLVSLLAETALLRPQMLSEMVSRLPCGRYQVLFWEYDHGKQTYVRHEEVVGEDLYVDGNPIYMHTANELGVAEEELWPALVERAYAQWLGHYGAVENIYLHTLFEAFFGVEGEHVDFQGRSHHQVFNTLQTALAQLQPTIVTSVPPSKRKFPGTGLVPDHAYALLSCRQSQGEYFVTVRNPWGHTEPGDDGVDDGVSELPMAQFLHYFGYASIATLPPA